jgi:hypothetical protein
VPGKTWTLQMQCQRRLHMCPRRSLRSGKLATAVQLALLRLGVSLTWHWQHPPLPVPKWPRHLWTLPVLHQEIPPSCSALARQPGMFEVPCQWILVREESQVLQPRPLHLRCSWLFFEQARAWFGRWSSGGLAGLVRPLAEG